MLLESSDAHPATRYALAVTARPSTRRLAFMIADDQLVLAHGRATRDVESACDFHEVLLRRVGVDTFGGLALRVGSAAARRESDGPFSSFGSQWSPTFSKLCLSAL